MTNLISDIYIFKPKKEGAYEIKKILQQVSLSPTGWQYYHSGIFIKKEKRESFAPILSLRVFLYKKKRKEKVLHRMPLFPFFFIT